MNLQMGNQVFRDVAIPLLWGERAILQDPKGRISVIDLSSGTTRLEILGDKPAPEVEFVPSLEGFSILKNGVELYTYNPQEKILASKSLELPNCQITASATIVGGSIFSGNFVSGSDVGIAVTPRGIAMGARLPPGLARLVV